MPTIRLKRTASSNSYIIPSGMVPFWSAWLAFTRSADAIPAVLAAVLTALKRAQVMDLAVASPATVSRCGMVYLDADQVGWRPLVLSWLATLPAHFPEAIKAHLLGLMHWLVPVSLRFVRREIAEASPTSDGNLITTLQRVFTACMEHLQVPSLLYCYVPCVINCIIQAATSNL